MLHWLISTDAGLLVRISLGACFFAVMAIVDLRKNGDRAQRWREYSVLLAAVVMALIYGVVNDQITSRISWEYFYYGKELSKVLGPQTPPDMLRLSWEAAKVGMKATWSVGLIFGVVLLLVNNPYGDLPRLKNRQLLRLLMIMPLTAAVFALVFGVIGYLGGLTWISEDFRGLAQTNMWRPHRFMTTWGIHLGGYMGGVIGTAIAVRRVIQLRQARR